MNIVASNGKVHRISGTRTACKTRIRECWQTTEEPLTCVRCGAPEPIIVPMVEPAPAPALALSLEAPQHTTPQMLTALNCWIAGVHDGILTISVIPDMPHVTVEVARSDLRAWCERRLTARKAFANKCIRGGSGSPVLGKISTR